MHCLIEDNTKKIVNEAKVLVSFSIALIKQETIQA